jgi:hypothetical protein
VRGYQLYCLNKAHRTFIFLPHFQETGNVSPMKWRSYSFSTSPLVLSAYYLFCQYQPKITSVPAAKNVSCQFGTAFTAVILSCGIPVMYWITVCTVVTSSHKHSYVLFTLLSHIQPDDGHHEGPKHLVAIVFFLLGESPASVCYLPMKMEPIESSETSASNTDAEDSPKRKKTISRTRRKPEIKNLVAS